MDAQDNQVKVKKSLSNKISFFLSNIKEFIFSQINELNIASKKMKDLIKTNYELGLYHLEQGNYSDAIFRFKIVIRFRKNHYQAYYNLGKTYYLKKNNKEALEQLHNCLGIEPGYPDALFLIDVIEKKPIFTLPENVIVEVANKLNYDIIDNDIDIMNKVVEYSKTQFNHNIINDSTVNGLNILEIGGGNGNYSSILRDQLLINKIDVLEVSPKLTEDLKNLKFLVQQKVYNNVFCSSIEDYTNFEDNSYQVLMSFSYPSFYGEKIAYFVKSAKKKLVNNGILVIRIRKSNITEEICEFFDNEQMGFRYSQEYFEQICSKEGLKIFYTKAFGQFVNYIFVNV